MIEATSPNQRTDGSFVNEVDAWADLDARLTRCDGLFKVYSEVPGTLLQPRFDAHPKGMRIDRLLVPTQVLERRANRRWPFGVIGIEAKKSGHSIGPPICQGIDYTRTAWRLPMLGVVVKTEWVMLWPCHPMTGDIGSVMVQNRIGSAYAPDSAILAFNVGGTNILYVMANGGVIVKDYAGGSKAGSR